MSDGEHTFSSLAYHVIFSTKYRKATYPHFGDLSWKGLQGDFGDGELSGSAAQADFDAGQSGRPGYLNSPVFTTVIGKSLTQRRKGTKEEGGVRQY